VRLTRPVALSVFSPRTQIFCGFLLFFSFFFLLLEPALAVPPGFFSLSLSFVARLYPCLFLSRGFGVRTRRGWRSVLCVLACARAQAQARSVGLRSEARLCLGSWLWLVFSFSFFRCVSGCVCVWLASSGRAGAVDGSCSLGCCWAWRALVSVWLDLVSSYLSTGNSGVFGVYDGSLYGYSTSRFFAANVVVYSLSRFVFSMSNLPGPQRHWPDRLYTHKKLRMRVCLWVLS